MTSEEKKLLQAKHRLEEAQGTGIGVKERKSPDKAAHSRRAQ